MAWHGDVCTDELRGPGEGYLLPSNPEYTLASRRLSRTAIASVRVSSASLADWRGKAAAGAAARRIGQGLEAAARADRSVGQGFEAASRALEEGLQGDRRSITRSVNVIWKRQQQVRERQRGPGARLWPQSLGLSSPCGRFVVLGTRGEWDELLNMEIFRTRCGRRRYWPRDGAGITIRSGLTVPWPIGRRRQRPNYLGLRHWILSRGVDFKWSRV